VRVLTTASRVPTRRSGGGLNEKEERPKSDTQLEGRLEGCSGGLRWWWWRREVVVAGLPHVDDDGSDQILIGGGDRNICVCATAREDLLGTRNNYVMLGRPGDGNYAL
jgi:hypothetical protein